MTPRSTYGWTESQGTRSALALVSHYDTQMYVNDDATLYATMYKQSDFCYWVRMCIKRPVLVLIFVYTNVHSIIRQCMIDPNFVN